MNVEKYYLGVFKSEGSVTTAAIPDVEVCETFGDSFEEAFENAIDALAACLSVPETIVHKRTPQNQLKRFHPDADIIPVPVDEKIIKSYEPKKKANLSFPSSVLKTIDDYSKANEMNRSEFVTVAALEYIENHAT
jgi:predicted RNase H-like HicB family nuclease